MAVAFLNTGATSMAAANWSDTTGFTAAAQLVIREGSQAIVNDLNQSASSIEFLDIQEGFSGNIGNASGSLRCDADGTAESPTTRLSRIRYNASGGNFYFSATGGNTLAHFVEINTGGTFWGTDGIMKNVVLQNGTARFAAAVAGTGGVWRFTGGVGIIDYAAALAIPQLDVVAGRHTLSRNATTLNVYGGELVIDCAALAITTITITGGNVRLLNSGTVTTVNHYGGTLDCSATQRPVTFTTMNSDFAATFIKGVNITIGTENVANKGARGRSRI
jgi:hypothetical protein